MGIEPTADELAKALARVTKGVDELTKIVDELFPEDKQKPATKADQRQYGKERGEE